MVLTGSPRPTFAETNAWLLEGEKSPATPRANKKKSLDGATNQNISKNDLKNTNNATDECHDMHLLKDYVDESTHRSSTQNANRNDLEGSPTRTGVSVLSHYEHRRSSAGDTAAGGADCHETNNSNSYGNHNSDNDNRSSNAGPMVGHAVVNAIAQNPGVGLYCRRAKLLQGTIDRPLWDQRRWTDGECLFSELVDRVGLESFENVGVAGSRTGTSDNRDSGSGDNTGADVAAGGSSQRRRCSTLGETGLPLHKTTNLSAHLITVPASEGTKEETMEEIARGILRFLKRKKSPLVSKVFLVLPPLSVSPSMMDLDMEKGASDQKGVEKRQIIHDQLSEAWAKLERYNDMIGQPKLMANAELEFVNVSV